MRKIMKSERMVLSVLSCFLMMILTLTLNSCSGGGGGGGNNNSNGNTNTGATPVSETASTTITSSGGTVQLANGAKIVLPANAVSASTTITMTRTNAPDSADIPDTMQYSFNGMFYRLEPADLLMSAKATITLPYGDLPTGVSPSDLAAVFFDGQHWVELPVSSVDTGAHTVSFETDHFTYFTLSQSRNADYQIKSPGINIGKCDPYLNVDFKVSGLLGYAWREASYIFGKNPYYGVEYNIQLKESVSWDFDKIIRSLHVYSVIVQDYYNTTGVVFNPNNRVEKGNDFLDDSDVVKVTNDYSSGTNTTAKHNHRQTSCYRVL